MTEVPGVRAGSRPGELREALYQVGLPRDAAGKEAVDAVVAAWATWCGACVGTGEEAVRQRRVAARQVCEGLARLDAGSRKGPMAGMMEGLVSWAYADWQRAQEGPVEAVGGLDAEHLAQARHRQAARHLEEMLRHQERYAGSAVCLAGPVRRVS